MWGAVLLLVACVVTAVRGNTILVTSPEIPREGTEFLMECEGTGDLEYFLLHEKGRVFVPHDSTTFEEDDITVYTNGTIKFKSLKVEYEGEHLCIRKTSEGPHGHIASLRVRPKPPADLWGEVYESMFITGFLAALILAALFSLGCIVYKFRWRSPTYTAGGHPILSDGYDNPAMSRTDETEPNCSTKM